MFLDAILNAILDTYLDASSRKVRTARSCDVVSQPGIKSRKCNSLDTTLLAARDITAMVLGGYIYLSSGAYYMWNTHPRQRCKQLWDSSMYSGMSHNQKAH